MVSKQKILIVDDDNNIAELISLYLTKECFDTMIVNDGESVMPAMETFAPNLILLDLMLPGIDGYQVCREVRAQYSVPIIMLSAKGETVGAGRHQIQLQNRIRSDLSIASIWSQRCGISSIPNRAEIILACHLQ